jgi:hypothetical protein
MATIYRAEVIGSLLRPAYLPEARQAREASQLSTSAFRRVEDRAVDAAIALQEMVGLDVITDGEMRRSRVKKKVMAWYMLQMVAPVNRSRLTGRDARQCTAGRFRAMISQDG